MFPEIHLWRDTSAGVYSRSLSPHACFSRGRMPDLNHRPPAWQVDTLTTRPQRPGSHSESLPCALFKIYEYQGFPKSRSQFEKFRHNADVPNIKYNCAVMYVLLNICFLIYFLVDHHYIIRSEFSDLLQKEDRIYCIFFQGVYINHAFIIMSLF